MKRVIVESPYNADLPEMVQANVDYLKECMKDCIRRKEAPLASHMLYAHSGVLIDSSPSERWLGIKMGFSWMESADLVVVYTDRGISYGMQEGISEAQKLGLPVEYRVLGHA